MDEKTEKQLASLRRTARQLRADRKLSAAMVIEERIRQIEVHAAAKRPEGSEGE